MLHYLIAILVAFSILLVTPLVHAQAADSEPESMALQPEGPSDCGQMEAWDFANGMCEPLAMPGMSMSMLMLHGNGFLVQTVQEKPRGHDALTAPNMFMLDVGTSVGTRNYLNFDLMATLEKWTYPSDGYPELLQIGEQRSDGSPFLDEQHPHSSPIMGATFSDTYTLDDDKDYVRLSFAPRGASTDGPTAFMHRVTAMVNPDAPLGHHIGQDVGHISSTVLAGSVRLNKSTLELSSFNGTEPQPTRVDLPLGTMNSYAARLTELLTPHLALMGSAAFVKSPEPADPTLDHVWRYSASAYYDMSLGGGWKLNETLIWGLINFYDNAASLNSFTEEILLRKEKDHWWGRAEALQRTPGELEVTDADPNRAVWVSALTLGYTRTLASFGAADLGLGGSLTQDYLPENFRTAYGGDPLTGRVFLQLSGMAMY